MQNKFNKASREGNWHIQPASRCLLPSPQAQVGLQTAITMLMCAVAVAIAVVAVAIAVVAVAATDAAQHAGVIDTF